MKLVSSASIFYGLTVRAADLIAAGRAYEALEPTLQALDLLQARHKAGRLIVDRAFPAVAELSGQVWARIRREAIGQAVEDARVVVLAEVGCYECQEAATQAHNEEEQAEMRSDVWNVDWERAGAPTCEHVHEFDGLYDWREELGSDGISNLLTRYRLRLGFPGTLTQTSLTENPSAAADENGENDGSAIVATLALADRALTTPRPTALYPRHVSRHHVWEGARKCAPARPEAWPVDLRDTVRPIDPAFFRVAATADDGFARFCTDFSVGVAVSGAEEGAAAGGKPKPRFFLANSI